MGMTMMILTECYSDEDVFPEMVMGVKILLIYCPSLLLLLLLLLMILESSRDSSRNTVQ